MIPSKPMIPALLAVSLVALAAVTSAYPAGTKQLKASMTTTRGVCDFDPSDTDWAEIDTGKVGECFQVRATEGLIVRGLPDSGVLQTACPVRLTHEFNPSGSCTALGRPFPLKMSDQFRVDGWGKDQLELSYQGKASPVVIRGLALDRKVEAKDKNNRLVTIGYYGTYKDFPLDSGKKTLRFYVYLVHRPTADTTRLKKYYAIEVFDPSDSNCMNEVGGDPRSVAVDCPAFDPDNTDAEDTSGGGGEPPPK